MSLTSKRAEAIDAYIKAHPSCKLPSKQAIEINGKLNFLDTYLLPIRDEEKKYFLLYNYYNRRFNIEIQEYEEKNHIKLDPLNNSDIKIIRTLLLQDKIEADKLYNDLKQVNEQREVAVITFEGVVINGNRRMATIEQLHEDIPSGKWNSLWVVRLPNDITGKDLWKIEAGLQLSKNKVADYGPVNNLLMIKEGKKAGLSEAEIAASMYGWDEDTVINDLKRLELIDAFLVFMNQSGNYGLIKKFQLSEHFKDIQEGLVKKMAKNGIKSKAITDNLKKMFIFLRGRIVNESFGLTHYDVRTLCKILQDADATFALMDNIGGEENKKDIPAAVLENNFDKAADVLKNKSEKDKPIKLIEKAITACRSIDRSGAHYKKEEVRARLLELDGLIQEMKKELGI